MKDGGNVQIGGQYENIFELYAGCIQWSRGCEKMPVNQTAADSIEGMPPPPPPQE
jgi:hypothetical protein